MKLAAVEGGGTSFVVAIARSPTDVLERAEFKTTTPEETLGQCCAWLKEREYDALGVASFGPVDLEKGSPTYGFITTTPKLAWKNTDILGPLLKVRKVPVIFDTDVNAPALAEYLHAKKNSQTADGNITSCAYITVGTGIGVGLVVNGLPVSAARPPTRRAAQPYPVGA
jgi:fructokinase